MTRFVCACWLLTAALVGCSPRRCAKGEVPNDTLQACVVPVDCDGGMADERSRCVGADAGVNDSAKRQVGTVIGAGRAGTGGFDSSGAGDAGAGGDGRDTALAGSAAGSRTVVGAAGDGVAGIGASAGAAGVAEQREEAAGAAGAERREEAAGAAGAAGREADEVVPRCGDGRRDPGERCDGDCPTQCPAMGACVQQKLVGSAAQCTAECQSSPVAACAGGDGCCPSGCTHAMDSDCSAKCGDGSLDPGERCESGSTKPCPTSCAATDSCASAMLVGAASSCSAECVLVPITTAMSGDGCCPPGADAVMDTDCKPKCGNGVLEQGEKCDGDCPTSASCSGGDACSKQMLSGSGCNVECKTVEITQRKGGDGCCPPGANAANDSDCQPVCGNGVKEGDEKCDGNCPTSASCSGGAGCKRQMLSGFGCNVECKTVEVTERKAGDGCCPPGANAANDSDCQPVCGNGVKEGDEKCDGDCPTSASCSGGSGCKRQMLSGSGCSAECNTVEITEAIYDDGCCLPGSNPFVDNDCPAKTNPNPNPNPDPTPDDPWD